MKSNRLNSFANNTTDSIAMPPPMKAEKKFVNICRQMLEIKWPSKLDGAIIKEYLKDVAAKFTFKLGITFLIFLIFSNVIIVIERKNETITHYLNYWC